MIDAVSQALRKYAVLEGRSGREEFWWFLIVSSIFGLVPQTIDYYVIGIVGPFGLGLLSGPYLLAILVPTVAVSVRRLHDVDRTGLWVLPGLIPGGVLPLLFFALRRGTPGPNHYGPDPRANTEPSTEPNTEPAGGS